MGRLLAACLVLGFCLGACGGLGGEPEIVATLAPQPPANVSSEIVWQPNITNGADIFAEHCGDCHGSAGDGRGELVLAGSVSQPLDMTDRSLTADIAPLAWFEVISEGKIENLMPPWRNALSEQERWDVAMYAYTLAYDGDLLQTGERIWQEQCAGCDALRAVPPIYSDTDYGSVLNRDNFDSALDAEELAATVAFARWQSLQSIGGGAMIASEGVVQRGVFTGRVEHGSGGGIVPADTPVQLQYGTTELGFSLAETTLDADLGFQFVGIPLTSDFSYIVSAVYEGRLFSRRLLAGYAADSGYDQTITIFDLTDDPFVISVAGIDLFFKSVTLNDLGSGLIVSQIIRFRNNSDRIYTSGRGFDDGREASLLLQFPAGAQIISGDENGRYVIVQDLESVPDSLIDTLAVPPGDGHEIIVEYFLPYIDGLYFEQSYNNLVDAELRVALPTTLTVLADALKLDDDPAMAANIQVYSGTLEQESDARLGFVIEGDPFATSSDDRAVITSDDLTPLLLGAGAVAAALLAGFVLAGRRKPKGTQQIDSLVRQLAILDEEHERGQINHDVYRHRRRALKDKLAALMHEAESQV